MVNDLREPMREASGNAPHDRADVPALLRHGRRRLRLRRAVIVGGTSLAAGAIALGSFSWANPSPADLVAAGVPHPQGPSIGLTEARPAVEGQDYRVLASHTNDDLNKDNGHVRNLTTGEESSFDPELGERCNLLGSSVAGELIAMSQYCGTYEDSVRDDRVQVVSTDGEQVITIQDSGVDGGELHAHGDFLTVAAYGRATGGTYVFSFEDQSLLRLSDAHAVWAVGSGPTPDDQFMWNSAAGGIDASFGRSGATVRLTEMLD